MKKEKKKFKTKKKKKKKPRRVAVSLITILGRNNKKEYNFLINFIKNIVKQML